MSIDTGTRHEGQGADYPLADDAPEPSPLDRLQKGLAAWLSVGVTLGDQLEKQTDAYNRLMDRLQRNTPVDYGAAASGVYPASGVLALNFGTPDQGTRWEVTNVVVGGTDLNVTVAGSVGLYVAGLVPSNNQQAAGGITNAADYGTPLPNVAFYGTRQLVVNDQEYLFAIVFGGTPGTLYGGNMSATVFNIAAAQGKDITIL